MSGYMRRYGTDVWVSVVICVFFVYLINRYYFTNLLEVIRADWPNQKCNPLVMPFAGFINKPLNESNFEFTANNFSTCVYDVLKYISQIRVNPFQYLLKIINDILAEIQYAVNAVRRLYDSLKNAYTDLMGRIYNIIVNITIEFIRMIVNVKDMLNKIRAVLINSLFVLFGSFMAMESMFFAIITLISKIIKILQYINLGFVTLGKILLSTIIAAKAGLKVLAYVLLSIQPIILGIRIPLEIMRISLARILNLDWDPLSIIIPFLPFCFASDTLIPLVDGVKEIKDIKIGDTLKNGWTVTATFLTVSAGQNLYNLKGVRVSGEHRVYHPTLQWIKVKDHPESVYLPAFDEPFLYCLNTNAKVFVIGDTLFSDWDDIDTTVLAQLQKNCVEPGFLPDGFLDADIHTYLESGFVPATMVQMHDGSELPLCDVKVNDRLANNTTVLAVVKLAGHDVKQYKHTFAPDGLFLCGTKNVHIADSNLGTINCMHMRSEPMQSETMQSETMLSNTEPFLYHLLTDTKFFTANNIQVNDYNYGIDAYLI